MSKSPRFDPTLALILLAAACVRLWGLSFGLPQSHCRPDESLVVQPALEYFSGDLNPHFFRYPSLCSYLVSAGIGVYYAIGRLVGHFGSLEDLRLEYLCDPSRFYLIARGLSASFGVATVWIVYRSGRRWFGREVGLSAAAFLALCHLHARDSHFGVTDVAQTFFIALAFERIQAWWDSGALRCATLAGVATGLAASSKYIGGLMVIPFLLAMLLRPHPEPGRGRFALRAALAFALAAAIAFAATSPYALIDFQTFRAQLAAEGEHLAAGQGLDLGSGWKRHLAFSLCYGLGSPLLLASLVGVVVLLWRDTRRAAVLMAFPLLYYALAGSGSTVFVRYAIPWTPFLALCAASLIVSTVRRVGSAWSPVRVDATIAIVTLLVLVPSALSVVRTDLALGRADSRELASRWIEEHVARGVAICQTSNYGRVQLPATPRVREKTLALYSTRDDSVAAHVARMRVNPTRSRDGEGYIASRFLESDASFICEGIGPCDAPPYVLVSTSPLSMYDRVPDALARLLAAEYKRIWSIETGSARVGEEHYDAIDAFYLPFAMTSDVERPGPDLALYERMKR